MMDVTQIVVAYLTEHGYAGLCLVGETRIECGCSLTDFAPCGSVQIECVAAQGNWSDGFSPAIPPRLTTPST